MNRTIVVLALGIAAVARAEDAKVDHSDYGALLKKYVSDAGLVDYKTWKATTKDVDALDAYLAKLGAAKEEALSKDEKLALYVNAYNAITLRAMLEFYPLKSI